MKTLWRFFAVLLTVASVSNLNWAASPEVQSKTIEGSSEIPFKLYAGYLIVVEGHVGKLKKLKFLLDTGVTHSVLDRKLADTMGPPRTWGRILNFDKTVNARWAEVPDIEFGPVHTGPFFMMEGDLRYFESFATKVDAVIGLDLLRLHSFSIDYAAHKVSFGRLDTPDGVPMNSDPACLTVQLSVGDHQLRLLVDSGAQGLVLYEDRTTNRLPPLKIEGEVEGSSFGGFVHSKRGTLRGVRLGNQNLDGTVFLIKAPPGNVMPGIDGFIGIAAFKAQRVDLNFETNQLAWTK